MLTHPNGIFQQTTFRPLEGAGPSNFYTDSRSAFFSVPVWQSYIQMTFFAIKEESGTKMQWHMQRGFKPHEDNFFITECSKVLY